MEDRPTEPVHLLAVGYDAAGFEGVLVEAADDLLGAIARLADGGIDVVLLALDLPDAGGVDAVSAIRERAPDVPVIGVAEGPEAGRALQAGATDTVPPDAAADLLSRAVRYAVALRRMRLELRRQQVVDDATGLYNALGFEQFAAHHVALAARSSVPLVLVTVRLDGLEDAVGDEEPTRTIAETAEVLRSAVRDADVVSHVSPGTFRVLLTGGAVGAETLVLSRIVDAVAAHNARSGHTGRLSLSIGAATSDPERPSGLAELVAAAEPAEDVR
ncbi:MAG: response regulator [Actinomycetota bacterium]